MNQESITAINLNDYKKVQLLRFFVPVFFRIRLLVIPLLLVLFGFFVFYKEPLWKTTALILFIGIAFTFFTFEFFRLKKQKRVADHWIGFNLLFVAIMQNGVFYLTGGFESPILPLAILFIILSNVIFDRGPWGFLVFGSYILGLSLMGLGAYYHIVPCIAPTFFALAHNGLYANPTFFWVLFFSYIVVFTNSAIISRTLSRLTGDYFIDLFRTREEVLEGFQGRMREIETIGSKFAHEIKNPLSAIKGLVQMLDRTSEPGGDKNKKRLAVIQEEIYRIETIVNDFANLTRPLDAINVKQLDIIPVIRSVVDLYEMRLAKAAIRLMMQTPEAPVPHFPADERKLKQVLVNIIENAIDATPNGGSINIAVLENHASREVQVFISDTGIGIAPEDAKRLFEPFFTTKPQGTGLGLTIARSIMRQHGGDLSIECGVGIGTTVIIRLPVSLPVKEGIV